MYLTMILVATEMNIHASKKIQWDHIFLRNLLNGSLFHRVKLRELLYTRIS